MTHRERYYPGQIVELYQTPCCEGPCEHEFDNVARYAIVVHAHAHPYNPLWIADGYDVIEYGSPNDDYLRVRSIARVASDCTPAITQALRVARRDVERGEFAPTFHREPPIVF